MTLTPFLEGVVTMLKNNYSCLGVLVRVFSYSAIVTVGSVILFYESGAIDMRGVTGYIKVISPISTIFFLPLFYIYNYIGGRVFKTKNFLEDVIKPLVFSKASKMEIFFFKLIIPQVVFLGIFLGSVASFIFIYYISAT